MYFVITIMLLVAGTGDRVERVYKAKTFDDTWECHSFLHVNKMELLAPHVIKYGKNLKSWEFYCESRYAEEV